MHDPLIHSRRELPRDNVPTPAVSLSYTPESPTHTWSQDPPPTPPRRDRDSSSSARHASSSRRSRREQQHQTDFFEVSLRESAPIYSSTKWTVHQHRVHIIRCAHCNAFLSDRGMRAVLLLKPHITLFSTDAPPISAGSIWSQPCDQFFDPCETISGENVERTCSCLTQSLGCFGCGNVIGYHIISPCALCSQSVAKHEHSANGHRYVFHHSEVKSQERRYIPGEPGIKEEFAGSSDDEEMTLSSTNSCSSSAISLHHSPPSSYNLRNQYIEQELPPLDKEPNAAYDHASHGSYSHSRSASSRFSTRRKLKSGDVIFWSMLYDGGERSQPIDPDLQPKRVTSIPGR